MLGKLMFLLCAAFFLTAQISAADAQPAWKNGNGHGNGKGVPPGQAKKGWGGGYHGQSFKGGPPPWAPAHGYRRKQASYAAPFDIDLGRCNRELLGQVLGGAAGAVADRGSAKGRARRLR